MPDALVNWLFAAPSIPNDVGGKYVAGAYIVFVVLLVVYVAIMAAKLQRIERDLRDLAVVAEERASGQAAAPEREEVSADV